MIWKICSNLPKKVPIVSRAICKWKGWQFEWCFPLVTFSPISGNDADGDEAVDDSYKESYKYEYEYEEEAIQVEEYEALKEDEDGQTTKPQGENASNHIEDYYYIRWELKWI